MAKNLPAMQETQLRSLGQEDTWVKKIPWGRKWQPIPVFLPEEFHGQRSLVDNDSPWGHKASGTTEWLTARPHFGSPFPRYSFIFLHIISKFFYYLFNYLAFSVDPLASIISCQFSMDLFLCSIPVPLLVYPCAFSILLLITRVLQDDLSSNNLNSFLCPSFSQLT